jgi:hypothetical protein
MIREFKFFHGVTIQSEGIQGIIRTLRAQWTREMPQELNNNYGIDAVSELSTLMSEQIAEQIDANILRQLGDIRNDNVNSEQTLLDILTSDTIIETDEDVIRGVERLTTLTRRVNGGNRA